MAKFYLSIKRQRLLKFAKNNNSNHYLNIRETVTAVIMEDHSQGEFICLYDFIVQMGNLSEKLAKDFTYTLLTFMNNM